jgi:hypothetical protein
MLGCVYTFEATGGLSGTVSATAAGIIKAAIRGRSQIRFQELTHPDDARSMFAVFFESEDDKTFFEALFGPLSEISGLQIDVVRCLSKGRHEAIDDETVVSSERKAG